jgi:hypothetical protein
MFKKIQKKFDSYIPLRDIRATHRTNKQQIMRTKALLLTAAVLSAGLAASVAQSVYSVNAVGYVNLNLPANFSLIANPLNGTNNNLSTVLPVVPDQSQVLTWDAANQRFNDASVYFGGFGWVPDGSLAPGQGAFLFLPSATTVTFVGEVPQGNLTNNIPANFGLLSHMVPQAIGLDAANLPAQDQDQVLFWDRANQRFEDAFVYFGGFGWVPSDPVPDVAEGFFYFNAGTARSWGRTFNVN